MKKITILFCFTFIHLLFVAHKKILTADIVVALEELNSKNYNQVAQVLNSVGGVRVKFYCETTNTAVLTVNRDVQPNDQNIITALQTISGSPKSVLVLPVLPEQVINDCSTTTVTYPDNGGLGETDNKKND
jgi:hypothetical protein